MYAHQTFDFHCRGAQREPNWRGQHGWPRRALSNATRRWLLAKGSLTATLVAKSDGDFSVEVLRQGWARPRPSEASLLGLKARQVALRREVLLHCGGVPWVFARSIIPVTTASGRLRHLRRFNDSALGAMLFADPNMRREPYEVALLSGQSLPAQVATDETLWGRRSCFFLDEKPLMVSEIFLPTHQLGD